MAGRWTICHVRRNASRAGRRASASVKGKVATTFCTPPRRCAPTLPIKGRVNMAPQAHKPNPPTSAVRRCGPAVRLDGAAGPITRSMEFSTSFTALPSGRGSAATRHNHSCLCRKPKCFSTCRAARRRSMPPGHHSAGWRTLSIKGRSGKSSLSMTLTRLS